MPNLFETAETVSKEIVSSTQKTSDKSVPVDGLQEWAALKIIVKTLDGELDVMRGPINETLYEYVVNRGNSDSFHIQENDTVALANPRRRASNSILNDIQRELLDQNNIPYEALSDQVETYIFNPAPEHREWLQKNADKLSDILTKMKAPEGFIQKQSAIIKYVVTDESVQEAFKKTKEIQRQILPVVLTMAIRPSNQTSLTGAWEMLKGFFGRKDKEEKPKKKKKS